MKYSKQFNEKKEMVQSKYVCAGFDGFIDYDELEMIEEYFE